MALLVVERNKLTVPQLAKKWGVASKKVIAFIRDGELVALNLASKGSTRPRYAIDVAHVEAFEAARRVIPDGGLSTTQRLRRGSPAGVKQFV
jgi:hypothetical protein